MSNPIKILAIEDDEFVRIFLRDVFWMHGNNEFDLSMVSDLDKANDILKNTAALPDLIFLDLGLSADQGGKTSIQNGLNFLENLKSNPKTKNIKVIVFTGYEDKEIKDRANKLGADLFLIKGEQLPQEIVGYARNILLKSKQE